MSKLVIDETKRMCIEYLAVGMPITEISKKIGKSRVAIYDWLKQDEFVAKLNERLQENKAQAEKVVNSKLPEALNMMWGLIQKSQSDKVKADLLKYWVDRQLGKPTSHTEITENGGDKDNIEDDVIDKVLNEDTKKDGKEE